MIDIENLNIDASAKANIQTWLNGSYDEETKQAIRDMMANPDEPEKHTYSCWQDYTSCLSCQHTIVPVP